MAAQIKNPTKQNGSKHTPRFDFRDSHNSNVSQTATIKELLAELNYESTTNSSGVQVDLDGKQLDISYLKATLRFLRSISGQALRSTTEEHPVATIKTIKTLFNYSHHCGAHLIGFIEPPGGESQGNIDILTSPPTPGNKKVLATIDRIISDIEKEISPEEKSEIAAICDPMRLREKYRQETNEAIDKILLTHIHIDDDLMKDADVYLADSTRQFLESINQPKREPRLHVVTYTYLKLLDYVHRLHFEIHTQLTISNGHIVKNKQIDFDEICRKLSTCHKRTIVKDTNFMSIDDVAGFINGYSSDIARLVSIATGFTYNKRDILGEKKNEPSTITDSIRAHIALQLYLLGANLPNESNPDPIGVVHVIAAFCSVLHQRKINSKLAKQSRRYGPQFTTPQKQLDAYINRTSEHVPYTAQFAFRERTRWYVHALLGRKDKADAHIAVQIAQSELSKHIFISLNHVWIREQNSAYRDFTVKAARDFVTLHKKQSTTYEWMHGG
ncbi:hypothetical protein [Stenotrophomonas lacuserhaii]|uniref:hypothetical protein n=1 Tax=Stenotrophomonas lacuserhaii TaxID=2760084 RepID=UPI0015FB5821|nr:hypothetical protein [Stenotrophomonas lacuserhaii]